MLIKGIAKGDIKYQLIEIITITSCGIFIFSKTKMEAKGEHLKGYDKWKEDYLHEIRTEQKTIKIDTDTYLITAVPFYNYNSENEFKKTLENVLSY